MLYTNEHWSKARSLHFQIGLIISLALMLVAFEWKSEYVPDIVNLGTLEDHAWNFEEMPPPITIHTPPPQPPPKVKQPPVLVIETDQPLEEFMEADPEPLEVDINETIAEVYINEPEAEEEEPTEIHDFVQHSAEFPGGVAALYRYLKSNLKYPSVAKRLGVEGQVIVQFVINRDGSVTDVKVLRGIGSGCDEEAIRVIQKSPIWKPAHHNGRVARQRMVLPVHFKLG